MLDRSLRRAKDACLEPLARRCAFLSPNSITLTGFVLGIVAAVFAGFGQFTESLAFWLASRVCDGLDGTLARQQSRQTDFGGYLDMMLDLVVYAAIPIGVAVWRPDTNVLFALAFLLASFYVNLGSWLYLSAILEKRGRGAATDHEQTTVTMPPGLIEGAETIVFYCLFLLWPTAAAIWFALMAICVLGSAGQRMLWALRSLGVGKE